MSTTTHPDPVNNNWQHKFRPISSTFSLNKIAFTPNYEPMFSSKFGGKTSTSQTFTTQICETLISIA